MQELKVANGESFNRQVEIKILPFVLAGERERTAINIKRIISHRKNARKNHLRWVSFWCAVAISICSTLSMMTSLFYVLPALAGIGYVALFQHVNKEAFDGR